VGRQAVLCQGSERRRPEHHVPRGQLISVSSERLAPAGGASGVVELAQTDLVDAVSVRARTSIAAGGDVAFCCSANRRTRLQAP
jgi:hypothetical protein